MENPMPRPKRNAAPTGPQLASDEEPQVEQTEESPQSDAILAPTFSNADGPTQAFLTRIVAKYHKPLADAGVNIALQFWADPEGAPSVKVSGIEKFGKVITFSADKRAAGAPDMRIVIDTAKWENATLEEREAALDGLLQSKEVCTFEESGEVKRDKAGRPKLKNRKYDLIVQGYTRVAEEHGLASQEGKQWAIAKPTFEQLHLFDDQVDTVAAR